MVLLTGEAKKFITERYDEEYNGSVGVLSYLRSDGTPNGSPFHFRIRDDEHLEFTEVFSQTLGDVLKKFPDVTVVFFDPKAVIGYRMKGKATLETFGPLFGQAASRMESMGFKPKALVNIIIEEVQSLTYGPSTGKTIS
jgi:hypothetical protein